MTKTEMIREVQEREQRLEAIAQSRVSSPFGTAISSEAHALLEQTIQELGDLFDLYFGRPNDYAASMRLVFNKDPGVMGFGSEPGTVRRLLSPVRAALTAIERTDGPLARSPESKREGSKANEGRIVFIVHGHDEAVRESTARLVSRLGLEPTILHEQPNRGQTVIEKFEKSSAGAHFAIILLTPDDFGGKDGESPRPRARQNVILELGFFFGALGRSRVCVLYTEGVELPSDYNGIVYVPLDRNGAWKLTVAKEMKAAGLPIDLNDV